MLNQPKFLTNTEPPITIHQGTNRLCTPDALECHVADVLARKSAPVGKIDLCDGQTAERVVGSIKTMMPGSW